MLLRSSGNVFEWNFVTQLWLWSIGKNSKENEKMLTSPTTKQPKKIPARIFKLWKKFGEWNIFITVPPKRHWIERGCYSSSYLRMTRFRWIPRLLWIFNGPYFFFTCFDDDMVSEQQYWFWNETSGFPLAKRNNQIARVCGNLSVRGSQMTNSWSGSCKKCLGEFLTHWLWKMGVLPVFECSHWRPVRRCASPAYKRVATKFRMDSKTNRDRAHPLSIIRAFRQRFLFGNVTAI